MNHYLFFDSSALVKYYHTEIGFDIVKQLFSIVETKPSHIVISSLIISETISVITRKHNRGELTLKTAQAIQKSILKESQNFTIGPLNDAIVYESIPYISKYNINASDALYLHQAIWIEKLLQLQNQMHKIIFITADKRLLRAAQAEGILALNPEKITLEEITPFIS